jgi:hypothetical protein
VLIFTFVQSFVSIIAGNDVNISIDDALSMLLYYETVIAILLSLLKSIKSNLHDFLEKLVLGRGEKYFMILILNFMSVVFLLMVVDIPL